MGRSFGCECCIDQQFYKSVVQADTLKYPCSPCKLAQSDRWPLRANRLSGPRSLGTGSIVGQSQRDCSRTLLRLHPIHYVISFSPNVVRCDVWAFARTGIWVQRRDADAYLQHQSVASAFSLRLRPSPMNCGRSRPFRHPRLLG